MAINKFDQLLDDLNTGKLTMLHVHIALRTHIKMRKDIPEGARNLLVGKHEGDAGLLGMLYSFIPHVIGSVELAYRRGIQEGEEINKKENMKRKIKAKTEDYKFHEIKETPEKNPSLLWNIWSEGFQATGDRGEATLHGKEYGTTFRKAVITFASNNPNFAEYFDKKDMTYWGCKLFDNEADARESFG
jgi:hypothetical protein